MTGRTNAVQVGEPVYHAPLILGSSQGGGNTFSLSDVKAGTKFVLHCFIFNSWGINNVAVTGGQLENELRNNCPTSGSASGSGIFTATITAAGGNLSVTINSNHPSDPGAFSYYIFLLQQIS